MYWYWVDKVQFCAICLYWFSVLLWVFQSVPVCQGWFLSGSPYFHFFLFSHLTLWGTVFESMPLSHLLSFSKSLLTVCETANLPSKIIISLSSVLTFFVNFSISSFCFFTCSSRFVWRSSSDIAGSVICGFSSFGTGCRRAVVRSAVFVGVAVILDLLFLFPETMVFVVFELFHEKIAS